MRRHAADHRVCYLESFFCERELDFPDGLVFNSYLAESTFGYDHEFHFVPHVSSTFGKQYMLYTKLRFLNAIYGET